MDVGFYCSVLFFFLPQVVAGTSPETIRYISAACGYTVMAENTQNEYRLDLCKGYTPQVFAGKVFHLHIRYPGDWNEIIFRNFLKHNPLKAHLTA